MKRGWTRFWQAASLIAVIAAAICGACSARAQERDAMIRVNELTLAGIRPGKDKLGEAEKRYKPKLRDAKQEADNLKVWTDTCSGRMLRLEVDTKGVIQSVTISKMGPREERCTGKMNDPLNSQRWATGRGLRLGEPRERVVEYYGEPNSSGPSVKGKQELELLFYSFDWAGNDVPQVMEVSCDRETGRVLEITLAFPSL